MIDSPAEQIFDCVHTYVRTYMVKDWQSQLKNLIGQSKGMAVSDAIFFMNGA